MFVTENQRSKVYPRAGRKHPGSLSFRRYFRDILADYPNITADDIKAALAFSSELSSFETRPYQLSGE